jgi:hypothetical protein
MKRLREREAGALSCVACIIADDTPPLTCLRSVPRRDPSTLSDPAGLTLSTLYHPHEADVLVLVAFRCCSDRVLELCGWMREHQQLRGGLFLLQQRLLSAVIVVVHMLPRHNLPAQLWYAPTPQAEGEFR